jgi:hypothetical protein
MSPTKTPVTAGIRPSHISNVEDEALSESDLTDGVNTTSYVEETM